MTGLISPATACRLEAGRDKVTQTVDLCGQIDSLHCAR